MRLRKGQSRIILDQIDSLYAAYWYEGKLPGNSHALCIVGAGEMSALQADKHKKYDHPSFISFCQDCLIIHPPAPKRGELVIRYGVTIEL